MRTVLNIQKVTKEKTVGGSLPDIDSDFPGSRRDEVKRYIEEKYGTDYVTAIGTFSKFKVKGAIKDLARQAGADYQKTNFITSMLPKVEKPGEEVTFTKLFRDYAVKSEDFKKFTQKQWKLFENIPLCLNQPKTSSIHASGVVIVPKKYGDIFSQMPIKRVDGLLVSEWEGEWIDKAGFLKFDILGVKQLDKLSAIQKLIKNRYNKVVTFDNIDLDNPDVMSLFKDGYCSDIFQFGTPGLQAYCKELKPDNIDDLIAAVALYRPGAMDSGGHKKYIKVKHGIEIVKYEPGTEEITKATYGQIVYQEQVMQIVRHMAGFTSVEADDVRKAMGKKLIKVLMPYKEQFIDGCLANGYEEENIIALWDKMESFASYAFNKSHAAAYAITGYYCQWYKVNYPMEFWTVSMQFAEENDIINRISEITKISEIEVAPVDINKSITTFYAEGKSIFWNLNSVKFVGDVAVTAILKERNENGEFFSIEEFCERITGKGVNKRCIINLLLSGAFDKIEKIKPAQRGTVLDKYLKFTNQKISEELAPSATWNDYQWILKQKELTGFGYIEYDKIVKSSKEFATQQKRFKENYEVLFEDAENPDNSNVVIAGILQNIIERKSKKGVFAQLEIIDNTDKIFVTLWNDTYMPYKDKLAASLNKIILLSGKIEHDSYKNSNVIHSKSSTKIEVV